MDLAISLLSAKAAVGLIVVCIILVLAIAIAIPFLILILREFRSERQRQTYSNLYKDGRK